MNFSPRSFVFALSALCAFSGVASAETWIVAADGTGQFTQIQSALAAAQDGDVIRVLPGSYSPFTLSKAVMIVGEGPELSVVSGSGATSIQGVTAGCAGVARLGLSCPLKIASNLGKVLIQDSKGERLSISACDSVLLEKWSGAQGASEQVSSLWILNSQFSWKSSSTQGADAFQARNSSLFVSGSAFYGGKSAAVKLLAAAPLLGAGLRLSGDCSAWIAESVFLDGEGNPGLKAAPSAKLQWDEQGEALFPLKILEASNGVVTMEFSGYEGDQILFLLSTKPQTPGIGLQPYVGGFPLGVDLSGPVNYWFLDRTIYPDGKLVWKHLLPFDPAFVGVPIFAQAFLYAPPSKPQHLPVLSAPTYWVIAEN